jgi:hypothetical protein
MAGAPAGYRTFTAGDVLTAAQVQTFLQDQVVAVYASEAAANAALPSPAAGQFRFITATEAFEYYTGSEWVNAAGAEVGFEQTFLLMGA